MNAIQQAIDAAGGPSRMAAALGVTAQAVCFWRDGKRRLPFDHGPAIERLAGGVVTRRQLFPNDWQRVWPELAITEESQPLPSATRYPLPGQSPDPEPQPSRVTSAARSSGATESAATEAAYGAS